VFFKRVDAAGKPIPLAERAVAINERLGTYGIPRTIYSYTRQFSGNDANIQQIGRINGNPCRINPANTNIGVVRMPFLGMDVYEVYDAFVNKTNPAVVHEIQSLSLPELLKRGVTPLFHTVNMLRRHGRIHLDIKPENIMIQPSTGDMRIIDYDLERPNSRIASFLPDPALYFLYPPELLLWQPGSIEDSYYAWLRTEEENKAVYAKSYKTRYLENKNFRKMMNKFVFRDRPKDISVLKDYKSSHSTESIQRKFVDTLDSYCLARSLLLLFGVYSNDDNWSRYENELIYIIGDILAPMCAFSVDKRLRIDDASILLDEVTDRVNKREREIFTTPVRGPRSRPRFPSTPTKVKRRIKFFDGGTRKKLKSRRSTKRVRQRT